MIRYTKRYINIISLSITVIIYIVVNNAGIMLKNIDFSPKEIVSILKSDAVHVELNSNNINQNTQEENQKENIYPYLNANDKRDESNWYITIPCLSLRANISEGTSVEVMNEYVGHFDETSKTTGNIGLAAHNRGYGVNYFANIKNLKEGDEIVYKYYEFEQTYIVKKNDIIKDTDWANLEKTEDNKITLITCVENEPEYRRCIQGIEKNYEHKGGKSNKEN